jgi:hypothetical protein
MAENNRHNPGRASTSDDGRHGYTEKGSLWWAGLHAVMFFAICCL